MLPPFSLQRRRFLKGLGASVALPTFGSLFGHGTSARAATSRPLATTSTGAPLRMAFVYFPNGAQQARWWPTGAGKEFEFNQSMQALEPLKNQVQVFSGLDHLNAESGPDGAGDHARANATFLTGVRARKTAGTNINLGVSIDQIAAQRAGQLTRLPSLELTCDSVRKSGRCDSGYSCVYQYNISWRSAQMPMAPEPNPRLVFERMFGVADEGGTSTLQLRQETEKSILDFVLEDTRSLQRQLGNQDRQKLDEYLTSVRDVEQRIRRASDFGEVVRPDMPAPEGIPLNYGEYISLMYDLLALAFESDSTRIATLLLAHDGSNRAFPELDVPEGHHYLTHNQDKVGPCEKIGRIDKFYMKHFARFLNRLNEIEDVDGQSVLHNSMIVYGSGNSDADRHTHVNLPVILAGQGGGGLNPGRYLKLGSVPMSNLYLGMLDRFGVEGVNRFGDADGRLDQI